jgi:hypothetical protein
MRSTLLGVAGVGAGTLALGEIVAMLTISACTDSGKTECDCADPSVRIEVPADRAAEVAGVSLSGRGCETATPQCSQPVGSGCAEYVFQGTAPGDCTVDVQFNGGPADFQEQVTFVGGAACCGGFYVQPASASPIDVPDRDGGVAG